MTEVTERFDDGRLNIIVTGERPFRVLDRYEAAGVPGRRGRAGRRGRRRGRGRRSGRRRRRARHSPSSSRGSAASAPEPAELEALDSYGLAGRVELPAETKQRLLELRSEPERMRVLAAALDALVDAVARSREIAERAKMNGKLIVGDF